MQKGESWTSAERFPNEQAINAVCCTISFFEDLQRLNRQQLSKYFEVYISVSIEVLVERDQKNLYSRALKGEIKNVVGMDLKLPPPANPDLVIDNSKDLPDFEEIAGKILKRALES